MLKVFDCSVIIPAHNAERTIGRCLEAIFASQRRPNEVIVVNDASTDGTAGVVSRFPCRTLAVVRKSGPMEPRFEGARVVRFPILIFVDADVCVRPDTFSRIAEHFEDPDTAAVTGMLAKDAPTGSFFGDYKNEYMEYIFKRQPRDSSFLYGSIWAIRKEEMIFFRPITRFFGSLVSDSEMGFRLRRQGKRTVLDHDLRVDHLKRYSFLGLLKNDFAIPFLFALMFVRYGGWREALARRNFSHASAGQAGALVLAFLASACTLAGLFLKSQTMAFAALACLILFYAYWAPFFRQVGKRGFWFLLRAIPLKFLDANVMFAGMMSGFFVFK